MKDCDFLPAEYHVAREQRRAVKLRASCVGGLIIVMVIWLLAHQHELAGAEDMHRDILAQHSQVKIHLAEKSSMIARRSALSDRRNLVQQLARCASPVGIFADLSRRLPATVVLTHLTLDADTIARYAHEPVGTPSRKPPQASGELAPLAQDARPCLVLEGIAGTTSDLLAFAAELESSVVFDRVQLDAEGSATRAGRRGVEFKLTCELAGGQRADP